MALNIVTTGSYGKRVCVASCRASARGSRAESTLAGSCSFLVARVSAGHVIWLSDIDSPELPWKPVVPWTINPVWMTFYGYSGEFR